MTVSSTVQRASYDGDGAQVAFPYTFPVLLATHMRVLLVQADGTEVEQVNGVGYTATGIGSPTGGTVTATTPPAIGEQWVILRSVPRTQELDLRNQGPYLAETVERALDLNVMMAQQLADEIARSLRLPESEAGSELLTVLPPAAERAGRTLGFDAATKQPVMFSTASTAVSAAMEPVVQSATIKLGRYTMEAAAVTEANVREHPYNAAGDGVSDDTAEIEAASAAANAVGSTLSIPPNDYRCDSTLDVAGRVVGSTVTSGKGSRILSTSAPAVKSTSRAFELSHVTIQPRGGAGAVGPALALETVPNFRISRCEIARESASSKWDYGIDLYSGISGVIDQTIVTNCAITGIRVRYNAASAYESNAVNLVGVYVAGCTTRNIEVNASHGFCMLGGVSEVGGKGLYAANADRGNLFGTWLENTGGNIELTGTSRWWNFWGCTHADGGTYLRTGTQQARFWGMRFDSTPVQIDAGASNNMFIGCDLPAYGAGQFDDSGTATQVWLCNVSGIGLYSKIAHRASFNMEQGAGDTFNIWRSDFAKFGIFREATSQNGFLCQQEGDELAIYKVTAGSNTEHLRIKANGDFKFNSLRSTNPGAGTKVIWYDPADSNRVKFAP